MNRTNALFGRDTIDLSVNGVKNTALVADVQVNFATVGRLTGHYVNNKYVFYDVQEFMPDYEAKLPVFSGIAEIDYQQWVNLTVRYKRNATELSSVSFDILKGAGSRISRQDNKFLQNTPVKFLTNQPRTQEIPKTGTAYVSLPINFSGLPGTISLKAVATMPNGTIQTKTLWSGTAQNGTVLCFDVSPYRVAQQFAVQPARYTVQMFFSDNTILSEAFTYIITDIDEFLTFVYLNSFGRMEVLNALCDYEMGLQVEPQRVQSRRTITRPNTEGRRRLSVEFVQLTEEQKEPLTELMFARKIYLLNAGSYIPLDCTTTDSVFLKTGEYFESMQLEFLIAHTNNSY